MMEAQDMALSSTSNAIPAENAVPLSEENISTVTMEPEQLNLSPDHHTVESTSTQTPKEDEGTSISSIGDSMDQSQNKDQHESIEETSNMGKITPVGRGTPEIDSCPDKPDIDVDTNVVTFQSHRIEPEGTTPVVSKSSFVSKSSQKFDDDVLVHVLSESRERPEDRETTTRVGMQRIESEDAMPTQEESVQDADVNGQNTIRKKPKEPPGTPAPAKHMRQKSETADERERRIKDSINNDQEELKTLDQNRVVQIRRDEGSGIEEKKGDDEISIQREPYGSPRSSKKIRRDDWEKINHQEKQPTTIVEHEKPKEMAWNGVEKVEKRYNSPSRTPQRHGHDFSNNHNSHVKSHAPNQPQTYNNNMRETTQTLSPGFFLEDDESIPIPHLPPLMVPGIQPSYDSVSLQGQSQQVHLNHNGYQQQFHHLPSMLSQQPVLPIPNQVTTMPGGKRKIHLHLWEDVSRMMKPETSTLFSFRRKKGILRRSPAPESSPISELNDSTHNRSSESDNNMTNRWEDRGSLTVSWYEGTNSLELQEHVQNSVIRKLGLRSTTKLLDFRVLDESSHPPEGMWFGAILFFLL